MFASIPKRLLLILFGLVLCAISFAGAKDHERHVQVSMRMVGHAILLNAGDSTSRVLPIEKDEERYRISFASDFRFNPEGLAAAVDSIMAVTSVSKSYLVEVEHCGTEEVVYSYKIGETDSPHMVPCASRVVPTGCYSVLVSILDADEQVGLRIDQASENPSRWEQQKGYLIGLLVMPFAALLAFLILRKKKREEVLPEPSGVEIGQYRFDRRNMVLSYQNRKVELTGKEAELLFLLYSHNDQVVERETMLKVVWGNDGEYIGRTLDVFISKLRKKLEADPKVRIINIRGVGYKLLMNR
jgi:hypothetical protein